MISAKSRKLLGESRQRIIAVTTNLFNSSCTSSTLYLLNSIQFAEHTLFFFILQGWFSRILLYNSIPHVWILLHGSFTSRNYTCWFHSKNKIKWNNIYSLHSIQWYVFRSSVVFIHIFFTGVRYVLFFPLFLIIFIILWDSQSEQNERTQISWRIWVFTSSSGTKISSRENFSRPNSFVALLYLLFLHLYISLVPLSRFAAIL